MKFKKFFVALCLCFSFAKLGYAAMPIDIEVNGNYIKSDPIPFISDGYTMVPIRVLSNVFDCDDIIWEQNEKKVTLSYNDSEINIYADSKTAYIGKNKVKMPIKPVIKDNKMYVSARFLCDAFGAEIYWEDKSHTVVIKKDGIVPQEKYIDGRYTKTDLEWLAKIVNAEAEGESEEGKLAVANVVLNRKNSDRYPNNIYDVIFDSEYGIQFTPVANGAIFNEPIPESYCAAKQALVGENNIGECLYFCNPRTSTSYWIINNREFCTTIGNHDFYY